MELTRMAMRAGSIILSATAMLMAGGLSAHADPQYRVAINGTRGAVLVSNPDAVAYPDCALKVQFVLNAFTPQVTTYRFPLAPHQREWAITQFDLRHYNTSVPPRVNLSCGGAGWWGRDSQPVVLRSRG